MFHLQNYIKVVLKGTKDNLLIGIICLNITIQTD